MTKKIVLLFTLLASGFLGFSQENTSSPYSYYGFGDLRFRGTHDARAIGGLNITGDSITLNLQNPASYSRLQLINFTVGGSTNFNNLKNSTTSEKAQRTSLDYLAVGIPMGKYSAAFGLIPYSAVGYKINTISNSNNLERNKQFEGNGNINRLFLGGSYLLNSNLSLGINIEYNFGEINNINREIITDLANNNNLQLGTREENTYRASGLSLNLGMFYERKINDKLNYFSSITYVPQTKLKVDNTRIIGLLTFTPNGDEFITESREINVPDSEITIPSRLTIGNAIGEKYKWMLGAEISFANTSAQNNFHTENLNSTYKNSQRYIIGGYYIPKYDSFTSYLSRVVYRAGFRYDTNGLVINNQTINDYGMNFGLGLPLGVSKIDVGFEFGKRGTTSSVLIQENYFNLSVGLSLSDKWFRKSLID
jgi:hypothetical protein